MASGLACTLLVLFKDNLGLGCGLGTSDHDGTSFFRDNRGLGLGLGRTSFCRIPSGTGVSRHSWIQSTLGYWNESRFEHDPLTSLVCGREILLGDWIPKDIPPSQGYQYWWIVHLDRPGSEYMMDH